MSERKVAESYRLRNGNVCVVHPSPDGGGSFELSPDDARTLAESIEDSARDPKLPRGPISCGCREANCPHSGFSTVEEAYPEIREWRKIHVEVMGERIEQMKKWGGKDHDDKHSSHDWIAYIVRHAGKAVMWPWDPFLFRSQMVRVAALAYSAIEWCDRPRVAQVVGESGGASKPKDRS